MKYVANWKQHLKRFSVQGLAAVATLQGAWLTVPQEFKDHIPSAIVTGLSLLIAAAALYGAFIHQGIQEKPDVKDSDNAG